jgi:hypothetical protein
MQGWARLADRREGEPAGPGMREASPLRFEIHAESCTLAQVSLDELQQSIARDAAPPADLSLPLKALWHDAKGNWDAAHNCAQEDHSRDGSWVHAYLHRKEGDIGNAGYWYSRAGRSLPAKGISLEAEWTEMARELAAR